MTEPHPLTDELAEDIAPEDALWSSDIEEVMFTHDGMRIAADWQLEQVKEAVSAKIAFLRQEPGWKEDADILEFYLYPLLDRLRPQLEES